MQLKLKTIPFISCDKNVYPNQNFHREQFRVCLLVYDGDVSSFYCGKCVCKMVHTFYLFWIPDFTVYDSNACMFWAAMVDNHLWRLFIFFLDNPYSMDIGKYD
jgi:hypothetical protein